VTITDASIDSDDIHGGAAGRQAAWRVQFTTTCPRSAACMLLAL